MDRGHRQYKGREELSEPCYPASEMYISTLVSSLEAIVWKSTARRTQEVSWDDLGFGLVF